MTDPAKVSTTTLWLGVALVVSLVVNTFFIGLAVGGRLTADHWGGGERQVTGAYDRHGIPPDLDPRAILRVLPESAQDDAKALLDARSDEIRSLFVTSMQARSAAFDAMRADPFDREALEQALAASRQADETARAAVHELMVDMIAGMTPGERAQVIEDMGERAPHLHDWRERHDRWRDRDRPPPPPGPRG